LKDKEGQLTEEGSGYLWKIKHLWIQFSRKSFNEPSASYDSQANLQNSASVSIRTKKDLSPFQQILRKHHENQRPQSQDEFENYCAETPSYEVTVSPIKWWTQDVQQKRWPRLSLFALDILSIPAMSDKPERVFSGARRTITWDKAQLNPDTIEVRELLQDWKRTDILGDLSYKIE
jgi:hAT family C-terminal dimerisation region